MASRIRRTRPKRKTRVARAVHKATRAGAKLLHKLRTMAGFKPTRKPKQKSSKWFFLKQASIPKRQMVPEGKWGDKWSAAVERSSDKVFSKYILKR